MPFNVETKTRIKPPVKTRNKKQRGVLYPALDQTNPTCSRVPAAHTPITTVTSRSWLSTVCHRIYLYDSKCIYTLLHHSYPEHADNLESQPQNTPLPGSRSAGHRISQQSVSLDVNLTLQPPSHPPAGRISLRRFTHQMSRREL